MVSKTYLEFMSDESGFGATPELVGFALEKGPELSLAPENFRTLTFTSSALVGSAYK